MRYGECKNPKLTANRLWIIIINKKQVMQRWTVIARRYHNRESEMQDEMRAAAIPINLTLAQLIEGFRRLSQVERATVLEA